MRLCESINRPIARSETHVDVARRPGDVPVLSWTKICRLPSTKSEKNDKSITSGLTSFLQKNHIASAACAIVDNHERQRHTEKLISPDLKTGEKTKLPI
jgi:hypothetical protein